MLKSLEIQGFKSFPDKTILNFNDGVTTIVGPNGSGKSNVAEAIRWVLGEQNARALRCDKKMEELIFHGTQNRGSTSYCEVTIRLDNRASVFPLESEDLAITRRLYRSGESEYYVNKTSVRLKDVLDLFLGTGLSRDGYAIIGQGRIAEILSDKSADRRHVFEEAAGISRFRLRRDEAQRKLQNAEENLTRIRDKIDELNLQREPLKIQAEKAKKYLILRDEMRNLEINVWLRNLETKRANSEQTRRSYQLIGSELEEGQNRLTAEYARAEQLSRDHAEVSERIEQRREAMSRKDLELGEVESRKSLARLNVERCGEHIARLSEELSGQSERAATLEKQIAEKIVARQALDGRAAEIERELETMINSHGSGDELEKSIGESEEKMEVLRENSRKCADNISTFEALSDELIAGIQKLASELETQKSAVEVSETELKNTEKSLKDAKEAVESLTNVIEGYKIRESSRRKKSEELGAEYRHEDREIQAIEARLTMLETMEREYEGFSRAVKAVMQENSRSGSLGALGTVADLVNVSNEHTLAIETALGGALQNIVVYDEEDAKSCISYLKNRDIGRATFMPLTTVKGTETDVRDYAGMPGFVGLGSELTDCDAQIRGVICQLLGRTIVAENLDFAARIARKSGFKLRVVTLDGQVVNAGGSFTGGTEVKNVGVLSRRNELNALRDKQSKREEARVAIAKQLKEAERDLSAAVYELSVAKDERAAADVELATLNESLTHKILWIEQAKTTIDTLQADISQSRTRLAEHKGNIDSEKRNIAIFDAEISEISAKKSELSEQLQQIISQNEDLAEKVRESRAEQSRIGIEKQSIDEQISSFREFLGDLSGDRDAKNAAIATYKADIGKFSAEIEGLDVEAATLTESRTVLENELKSEIESRLRVETERNQCEKLYKELNEHSLRLEKERGHMESKIAIYEQEEKQILDALWENYELSHQEALKVKMEIESFSAANRRVAELKKQIAALGNVNIGAIEDFERINERWEYLDSQSADATDARAELLRILEEIVISMKDVFSKRFEEINSHFSETIVEIFGGGQGYLELDDPEDILGCGIDIRVQPPGKRLGSLSPLSGGEKSLVAIALYFAIFKVNPAPFCVLDEVDHDLDDVNVTRYANYLKRMSKTLQFAVVTHRRGTMEIADHIYGVTAEQQGVSKVLALNLTEIEQAIGVKLN